MFLVFLIIFSGSMKICHLYILSVMSDEYSYFCFHQGEKKKKNRSFIMHVHTLCILSFMCSAIITFVIFIVLWALLLVDEAADKFSSLLNLCRKSLESRTSTQMITSAL